MKKLLTLNRKTRDVVHRHASDAVDDDLSTFQSKYSLLFQTAITGLPRY